MVLGRSRWPLGAVAAVLVLFGAGAFLAYGGTRQGGTPRQQMASWVSATDLGSDVGTVIGDAARVTTVLDQHRGTGAIHTACGVLVTDAESGNGELPSPDTTLTNELSRGYTLEYDAGNDCYDAGTTNQKLLARFVSERTQALLVFRRALSLVERITGTTVSTTTTTQPDEGGIFG